MANFKLDSTNDIIIGRGATRVSGAEYVLQLIKNRLSTLLGEWELDTSAGVPWSTQIIKKGVDLSNIEGIIYNVISKTPGVATISTVTLTSNHEERKLFVSFEGRTIYGTNFIEQGVEYGRNR